MMFVEFANSHFILPPFQFTGIEAIAGVSLVTFTSLAWMKFIIADKLNSESLRTDGK